MTELSNSQLIHRLRTMVDDLNLTSEVKELLLPNGEPHDGEKQLWDYKEKLPTLPEKVTDETRKLFNAEIGDIMKDVVAFHNAYGGYIVFGVADKGKSRVVGVTGEFDCADFNKRLCASVGDNLIECDFRLFTQKSEHREVTIGILLVPRRAYGATPVRFIKEGPIKPNGSKSFNKDTYVRIRDECRPATSTSSDWMFLHSDRSPAPATKQRTKLIANLPARDPDLVEFLGRDEPLARLRDWVGDPRSPVRLITGIGGLGKTTLAYRFAEEVCELGAGALEQVIWVAAKVRTFSALKGEMVPVGRVDFHDLNSLYGAILRALSYEMEGDDTEEDPQELEERIIEALCIVPALIVVDDIDSLDPDEQRRVVGSMNTIGLRTVGRELPSSKILMTSRIDQGLPQTAALKLDGLERAVFDEFLANVAKAFGIPTVYGDLIDRMYESSSGSPLFAASILRLVKLGENINHAIEHWKGQDGEDVRAFAFEREIKRLGTAEARLLLAVLLLGETSVGDLANVLDLTPKAVRDRIAHLQTYHLLATSVKGSSDTTIFVPRDLLAVKGILQSHLGPQADSVQEACAKAEERSRTSTKSIGLAIRTILSLWKEAKFQQAVIAAKKLASQHPKNGDVMCILGASLLRTTPRQTKEADMALDEARRLNCVRPELPSYIIQAKTELEDWQGLYMLTKSLSSNEAHREFWLNAFVQACRGLIGTAKVRGDDNRVAELSLEVIERITRRMQAQKLTVAHLQMLIDIRFDFAREYYNAAVRLSPNSGDQLNVFEAVMRLAEFDVLLTDLIRKALSALEIWWTNVERRPMVDETARTILARQIRRLVALERQLSRLRNPPTDLISLLTTTSHELSFRGAQYS